MCFTNLPVEFDENGDPYLAKDAEAVDRPGDAAHDHADGDCGCGDADASLESDPEAAYETIVAAVSESTRAHLTDAAVDAGGDSAPPTATDDAAEGD